MKKCAGPRLFFLVAAVCFLCRGTLVICSSIVPSTTILGAALNVPQELDRERELVTVSATELVRRDVFGDVVGVILLSFNALIELALREYLVTTKE